MYAPGAGNVGAVNYAAGIAARARDYRVVYPRGACINKI